MWCVLRRLRKDREDAKKKCGLIQAILKISQIEKLVVQHAASEGDIPHESLLQMG